MEEMSRLREEVSPDGDIESEVCVCVCGGGAQREAKLELGTLGV